MQDDTEVLIPHGLTTHQAEMHYVIATLKRNKGNRKKTGEVLGISQPCLRKKLHRYEDLKTLARR